MKRIVQFFFMGLLVLNGASAGAEEIQEMLVIVDPANRNHLAPWVDALESEELRVTVLDPDQFDRLKGEQYGCVFAVTDPADPAYPFLVAAFSPEEMEKMGASSNGTVTVKRDVFSGDQRLLFFVGRTPASLDTVRRNMRSAWMPFISTWYNIEDTSMHGY